MNEYEKRMLQVHAFNEQFDDMPDGAFFALAEEQGIYIDDWIEYEVWREEKLSDSNI